MSISKNSRYIRKHVSMCTWFNHHMLDGSIGSIIMSFVFLLVESPFLLATIREPLFLVEPLIFVDAKLNSFAMAAGHEKSA